jgi:putative toxin-antitoxin system antitoxin component (TIGR02293 family)
VSIMFFLTRPRSNTNDSLFIETESLRTLHSFAIADRIKVASDVSSGIELKIQQVDHEVTKIDLTPLFEAGLITEERWKEFSENGLVEPSQSELLLRYVRIFTAAEEIFGAKRCSEWLVRSNSALKDMSPVQLLGTEDGGRAVETLLGRINYGLAS